MRARRAIVAIPPALAGRIRYTPALPGLRDELTQRTPQGAVIKCHAVYDEPFWRRRRAHRPGGLRQRAGPKVFDNSPPDGSPGVLVAFLEGGAARELGTWAPADRRAAVLGTLTRLFGPRAASPRRTTSRTGPTRSGAAAATAATSRPAGGPRSAARCARRSGRCTGPARSMRSAGAGTWTEPCGRGRAAATSLLRHGPRTSVCHGLRPGR